MKKPFCEELLPYYPNISEVQDFHSSYTVNCVVNVFSCYITIVLNIITIHAIRKTSSLSKSLKTLLLSLGVSDLGVSLLVQPLYTWLLVKWLKQIYPGCVAYTVFSVLMNLFFTASFYSIMAITMDRFFTIHLHLRYQELVTHKRVVAVMISIWIFSAFSSLKMFWLSTKMKYLYSTVGGVLSLVITTLAYFKIYFVIRRHRNDILALQVEQDTQNVKLTAARFASLRRSTVGTFYVYLVFLACFLPRFICLAALKIYGPSAFLKAFSIYSTTLMFLNSSFNPFIYCWKMKYVRQTIINIIRNMAWYRNFFA